MPSRSEVDGSGTLVLHDEFDVGPLEVPLETKPEQPLGYPPTCTTKSAPFALTGMSVILLASVNTIGFEIPKFPLGLCSSVTNLPKPAMLELELAVQSLKR